MNLKRLMRISEKFVVDNSPAILTGIGVVGTISTAFLTGRAAFKAAQILETEHWRNAQNPQSRPLTQREELELVWEEFIPPVIVGIITIAAIIGSNRIGSRRTAALAAAYSISEKAFIEYREKVVETIGKGKEQKVRDELAQERFDRTPTPTTQVLPVGPGNVLCYDQFTGRYFQSDMETIKKAQNDTNYQIINEVYASLSDFYQRIGLPPTSMSDEVGWSSNQLMEIEFSTVMSEDGRPCISINFLVEPVRGYYKFH